MKIYRFLKFGPDRFSRFDVYTNRHPDKQSIFFKKMITLLYFISIYFDVYWIQTDTQTSKVYSLKNESSDILYINMFSCPLRAKTNKLADFLIKYRSKHPSVAILTNIKTHFLL